MRLANLFHRTAVIAGDSLAQSKNRAAVILAAASVLGACVSSPQKPARIATSSYHLSAGDLEVIKRDLASDLKDPASAIFGAIAAVTTANGVVMACGVVNGRNSYGGYSGKRPFSGVLATNTSGKRVFAVTAIGGSDTHSLAIMMECQRYGLG